MNDNEKVVFRDFLQIIGYYSHKPTKGKHQGLINILKKISTMM